MKKPLILFSILFSLVLFIFTLVGSENLNVSCEAGGPYMKNSTVNIFGNVINVTGTSSNVSITINSSSSTVVTKNITSDSSGNYQTSISSVLDVGNYTVNVTAEKSGVYGNCTDSLQISYTGATGVSVNRTITVNGTAVYRDTGKLVTSGTVYLSVVDQNIKSTASIGSDGRFSIPIYPRLILGEKYYLILVTEDGSGKSSWAQILYVAT
jgi:hypothetical protein